MITTPEAVEAALKYASVCRNNPGWINDALEFEPHCSPDENIDQAAVRILAARVRELERERGGLVEVINGVLASATPSQKEHPTMFAAWAACQAVLMDKPQHPQPEQAKEQTI